MPPDPERRFEADELRRFLAAVDRHLTEPVRIRLIGGSAIALHGVEAGTNDLAAIEKLHQVKPLNLQTLITRYLEEMNHVTGNRERLDQSFALMIERLFGEREADRVERTIRTARHSGGEP